MKQTQEYGDDNELALKDSTESVRPSYLFQNLKFLYVNIENNSNMSSSYSNDIRLLTDVVHNTYLDINVCMYIFIYEISSLQDLN